MIQYKLWVEGDLILSSSNKEQILEEFKIAQETGFKVKIMSQTVKISHEFCGYVDYWGGNGKRWNDNVGCLFAHYGPDTTLCDIVDQWVDSFGVDCDFEDVTEDMVREAILNDFLNDQGRADYHCGALCDPSANWDGDEFDELPVWIILIELED